MRYDKEEALYKARNQIVAKDNVTIQNAIRRNVEKKVYKLTLFEQKALAYIISMIKKPEEGKEPIYDYKIDTKLFCDICGIENNSGGNKLNLEVALRKLSADGVWIKTERNSLLYLQWITTPEIKEDYIEVTIPRKTMPYLYGLKKNFTEYNLEQILCLSGKYSIALFELLKSNAYKHNFDMSIEEYREYMGLDKEYKEFKELRRWTIDKPLNEINEKPTGLKGNWEPIRGQRGRNYVALRFYVEEKDVFEQYESKQRLEEEKKKKKESMLQGKVNLS